MIDKEIFYTALSQGKMDEVKKLTQEALDAGDSPDTILKEGLIQAMEKIRISFSVLGLGRVRNRLESPS